MKSKLIIVGGFLGAGKTSLLWEVAKHIKNTGENIGLITNDQASELVDTTFLETSTDLVKEVSGSCFCCNFNGFADAIKYINEKNKGSIIIAEPVGSCTDLSATLMQPLKDKFRGRIDFSPLTVLADPSKLKEILDGESSAASYIITKQFEEADVKAAFGWLNASFSIEKEETKFNQVTSEFLENLSSRYDDISATVGHVKFILQGKENLIIGNITGTSKTASLR